MELWAFGLVGGVRAAGAHVELNLTTLDGRSTCHGLRADRVRARWLPESKLWPRRVAPGPHMVLLRFEVDRNGDVKPQRLIVQAVLDWDQPVPVDSGLERAVLRMAVHRGVPFAKPLFADVARVRPDIVFPDHRIALEIQGGSWHEYRMKKHITRLRERYSRSPSYRDQLVCWSPNLGETRADLLRDLPFLAQG